MPIRNVGELAQRPAAARLIANGFHDSSGPVAAIAPSGVKQSSFRQYFGSKRGERELFFLLRGEFERETVCCQTKGRRAKSLDALNPLVAGLEVQVHAHGAARSKKVMVRFAGTIGEDCAAPPLDKIVALHFTEPAVEDDAEIVVGVPMWRNLVACAV